MRDWADFAVMNQLPIVTGAPTQNCSRCGFCGTIAALQNRFAVMKFNHLIQINDPLNPLIDVMTREELWRGLVLRPEAPKLFMPHLDACELSDKNADSVRRMLRYGELVIADIVTYQALVSVHYQVPAQGDIPVSGMSMTIEEPAP